jgi:hypothetical protein
MNLHMGLFGDAVLTPKGKDYSWNRNYILDLCWDGALQWRLKKGGSNA